MSERRPPWSPDAVWECRRLSDGAVLERWVGDGRVVVFPRDADAVYRDGRLEFRLHDGHPVLPS